MKVRPAFSPTPIIFSTSMVQAILSGVKTQTRRIVKPQPNKDEYVEIGKGHFVPIEKIVRYCPYGTIKSKLWVKETFCYTDLGVIYKADMDDADMKLFDSYLKWKPSIFMPQKLSRITLEITGIKVERIQDISLDDCWKEGIAPEYGIGGKARFIILWDSINAKRGYGWSVNPWVYVIEFRRI